MVSRNTKILCRAQGGEPVVRTVETQLIGAFQVVNAQSGRSCLFPEVDTFEFDQELASKLDRAYREGRIERLRALWDDARQLTASVTS